MDIIVICPHCDAKNAAQALDHQGICVNCREPIPIKLDKED